MKRRLKTRSERYFNKGVGDWTYEQRQKMALEYLDALFGDRHGYVYWARGVGGRFEGSYRFDRFLPASVRWPDGREAFVTEALRRSERDDVFVTPMLRDSSDDAGKKGTGIGGGYIWADIDQVESGLWREVDDLASPGDSMIVCSGRNIHLYLALDRDLSAGDTESWNQRLAQHLAADAKWSENSLLRLPGTYNHKGRARGGESTPVWLLPSLDPDSREGTWTLRELNDVLPPKTEERLETSTASAGRSRKRQRRRHPVERQALEGWTGADRDRVSRLREALPAPVLRLLDEPNPGEPHRSGRTYSLVAMLVECGLGDDEIYLLARTHEPSVDQAEDGKDLKRDVDRIVQKHRELHDHEGQACTEAGCSPRPLWMSEEREMLAMLVDYWLNYDFPGRARSSDLKAILALLLKATRVNSLELFVSVRDLADEAGICKNTARKALDRLMHIAAIERLDVERKPAEAYSYRISTRQVDPQSHKSGRRGYGSILELVGADAFRHGGLNGSGFLVYVILHQRGPLKVDGLMKCIGYSETYLSNTLLPRLKSAGIIDDVNGRWQARPVADLDLETAATAVRRKGRGERQRHQHQGERQRFRNLIGRGQGPKVASVGGSGH